MPKTISGIYTVNGYVLSGASRGVLNPVTVTGLINLSTSALPGALYSQGPSTWTVTNQGSITGGNVAAIALAAGGSVTNSQAGYLSGHLGVSIQGAASGVTNRGIIFATNPGTSASA